MFSLLSGMYVYLFGLPQYNVLVVGLDNSGKSTFLYQVDQICDRKKKKKVKTQATLGLPTVSLQKKSSDQYNPDDPSIDLESKENGDCNDPQNLYRRDPKLRQILPTMGQNVKVLDFDNMSLQFWDLPGQQSFRRIWTNYYSEVHAIVFMVDSADTERLKEARQELHKLLNEYELRHAPFLVLANKQDMNNAVDYQSIVSALQLIGSKSLSTPIKPSKVANQTTVDGAFRGRSVKVMCTCCLNKEGLSNAISWLVYTIPNAKQRLEYVEQIKLKKQQKSK